ncbi:YjbG polysaccharide synthesis-related protein [Vibrio alfacsensis]|uniref:YjbG polysaccharide synthesis-related protein n=1 Tax=Vibrio alfacsensis TaxID=1074311 RepID=UPI002ADE4AAE|nr:YjbG polysaccharide synthesis-related protein [Vibrio alfacsensis]WQE76417.1 YjbG polysaccharide synthesis-related protein [Vibrio alfacsensis]
MNYRRSALISGLLFAVTGLFAVTSLAPVSAQPSVNTGPSLQIKLIGTDKQLQSDQGLRLADALKLAQQQRMVLQYPLGTTLFDESDDALQKSVALKNSVLNQMMQHNLVSHPLYKFIQKQQFAPRVLSGIDVDQVRLDKFDNPLLNGKFSLASSPRDSHVVYLGNVDKVWNIRSQAGIPLQTQIDHLSTTIGDLSQSPIVIYPDGNVAHPHHGSWLNTQYYLPPLTMVYIPFAPFSESQMDQDIVKLLTQLKPMHSKTPL